MSDRLFELFDEYAAAYARGERPSAEDFLERAGSERDQLAALLGEYVGRVPAHPPGNDDQFHLELLLADEPPLLVLRRERKLRREEVVEILRERLGLPAGLREKLGLRYHELETGQLEPARVDRRVWAALAEALQARADELTAWAQPRYAPRTKPAFFRAAAPGAQVASAVPSDTSEIDEVDRLFGLT